MVRIMAVFVDGLIYLKIVSKKMPWQKTSYKKIDHLLKPGDVIAFSGIGIQSDVVRRLTSSIVSHVGIVISSKKFDSNNCEDSNYNYLIEATNMDGFTGVIVNKLCERINSYAGEIWWLPLSDSSRAKANIGKLSKFLNEQNGKEYDCVQAIMSAIDLLDHIPILDKLTRNEECYAKFFCSELVAAGLKEAGVIQQINASEVTPIDVCRFSIFAENYFQLKGEKKEFDGYNQFCPEGFGICDF